MKSIISTLAIGICCLLVSCNNEQENTITDNTTDLASFEATLAKKYEGKTVYYNNNRPDYSKEIEYLKSVSTEEPMDNIRTKSSDAAAFGPWGSDSGVAFDAPAVIYNGEKWKKINAIKVRHGAVIDAIQLYWVSDNDKFTNSPQFGGNGGAESWMFLSSNEYIKKIEVHSGTKIDYVAFTTNLDKVHVFGGPGGANRTELEFGVSGFQMHGIYGKAGAKLYQLGIYCYPNSLFN
ncbi:hypothetical protein DXA15_15905 [Parabacteroides sp. AM58-2XD]|uniref:jacalin-like lectin n=1 Tax=Parabacteroides TaxID=375288 RepID=UPI000FE1FB60|nr:MULTISPECIES: jacalin-like lectin [Parabacteroides]MCM0719826.1 hypothetical protein [Parabacteroides sp. W1-Q-101]RGY95144.1 hypothetical protein DXA15_15905 [Parabacteroides sp. AM58-2XD]GKG72871.1 hypothetical protein CE91St1_20140 [Parabacteroides goldsteinii]GKG78806.1 hypothetical protein CE91St2_19980 [Parabacteroides goldsteinii]